VLRRLRQPQRQVKAGAGGAEVARAEVRAGAVRAEGKAAVAEARARAAAVQAEPWRAPHEEARLAQEPGLGSRTRK
jgi:hypothetical protein